MTLRQVMTRPAMALLVLALTASPAASQDVRRDGNWWNGQTEIRKADYVLGVFDGMQVGKMYAQPVVRTLPGGGLDPVQLREFDAIEARFRARMDQHPESVTTGQVSDGLDEFYKDFRNRSIPVFYGVDVVFRQISGEKVESMVESLRRYVR